MSIVVCGLVCVSVSFFCERILILKWKGICFSPNLTFIQGRHNWWKKKKKKKMSLPSSASCARKEKPSMKWQMQGRSKKPMELGLRARMGSDCIPSLQLGVGSHPASHLIGVPAGRWLPSGRFIALISEWDPHACLLPHSRKNWEHVCRIVACWWLVINTHLTIPQMLVSL